MAVVYKWSWIGYFGSVCLISDICRDYWLVLRSSLVIGILMGVYGMGRLMALFTQSSKQ